MKGLVVDLVILNERGASYVQDLQIALETLVRTSRSPTRLGFESEAGGIFVLRSNLISAEPRSLLLAVARVVLLSRRGGLADQLDRVQTPRGVLPPARRKPVTDGGPPETTQPVAALAALQFFNGLGGFSPNGREYVTVLGPGQSTPAPWINVVSNPSFGFQVAAEGGGYTWSQNSRDNQLTPWSNDPVSDRPGEVLYVRDLDSGTLWTPTALPIRLEQAPYIVRHGRGYSRFDRSAPRPGGLFLVGVGECTVRRRWGGWPAAARRAPTLASGRARLCGTGSWGWWRTRSAGPRRTSR